MAGFVLGLVSVHPTLMLWQEELRRWDEPALAGLIAMPLIGAVVSFLGYRETEVREGRGLAVVGLLLGLGVSAAVIALWLR
jgi:hypothetical protein